MPTYIQTRNYTHIHDIFTTIKTKTNHHYINNIFIFNEIYERFSIITILVTSILVPNSTFALTQLSRVLLEMCISCLNGLQFVFL